jgi:hypothetical protein
MLKKITRHTIALLVVLSLSANGIDNPFKSEERIHHIKTEFTMPMADVLIAALKRDKDKSTLIDISSPGGHIMAEAYLMQAIRIHGETDTLVTYMAASAAAQTFLAGVNRYVEPTAAILFHGAANGHYGTVGDVKKRILISDSLEEIKILESVLTLLNVFNEASLKIWEPLIAASNGKLTKEIVIKTIYNNYEKDVFVSGQQLIDLGIAQDAKLIDYDKYK